MSNKIHFNNAGSSLSSQKVLNKINDYLISEKKLGGYEAQLKFEKELQKFYFNIAQLINCSNSEISFLPNSTVAWNLAFNSIPLTKKDEILIIQNEYTSNHISILKKKNCFKKLRVVNIDDFGMVNLEELGNMVNKNTKVVSVNHIASQCGTVLPIEKIGSILKKINSKSFYIVDSCQSLGQVPIDVKKIKCDFLSSTGRKYLKGPRGTGFLYINKKIFKSISPVFLDIASSEIYKTEEIVIKNYPKMMESFEHSPALKIGLSTAVNEILDIGVENIKKKIIRLSKYFREKISEDKRIIVFEDINALSGINTIELLNEDVLKLQKYLSVKNINTYISNKITSKLYFSKIKKENLLRISFHHFNTKKEIDYLIEVIKEFKH